MAAKKKPTGISPRTAHQRRVTPKRRALAPQARRRQAAAATARGIEKKRQGRREQTLRANTRPRTKVGFVFSNDPDPMLVERMWALEESGRFEAQAIYWHRSGSDLSFPFSPQPFSANRFTKVDLRDPGGNPFFRIAVTALFAWKIMRWVRKHDLRILHVIYPNMLIAAFLATLGRKIEIVYDVWDVNHSRSMSFLQRTLYRLLLSKTRLVFTTSQAFIDQFEPLRQKKAQGATVTHVSNAPYALDKKKRTTSPRRAKPKDSETLVIGCVGNLRVPKQLQMLFDAVTQVRSTGRDIRIRLSGAGSRKKMVLQAASASDFVEYTGPYDYRRDAPKLYAELDLVYAVYPLDIFNYRVHVARRLHDAVLSSTPVVVSRNTHMSEIVTEEGIGWEIGHESTAELVALLTNLHDNRTKLAKAASNASLHAHQHSFSAYREKYVEAYAELQEAVLDTQSPAAEVALDAPLRIANA